MADQTTITTHRTPAGTQVDPAGSDTTYTNVSTGSGGKSFGFLVGAGIAVIATLLVFLFLAGPEGSSTVGTGGENASESAIAPEDGSTAPVEQSAAPADDTAAPADDTAAPAEGTDATAN